MMNRYLVLWFVVFLANTVGIKANAGQNVATDRGIKDDRGDQQSRMLDFIDPTYGGRIRQIFNPAGDEHDLYHYRSVFNADNSRMLGIETPHGSTDYVVTLYDGDGRFLKKLFTQKEFNWTLAWDRRDPRYLYTRNSGTVYRYDVEANQAEALRTFEKPTITQGPTGLSLNQRGDRLLLRMSDLTVRTYRLPALDDERICTIDIPNDRYANWDKLRFTGYKDTFAVTFEQKQPVPSGTRPRPPFTRIYDGVTGQLLHTLDEITVGHHDFSPDGKLAYVEGYFNQGPEMKVRVVNLDGSENHVVFTAPREKLRFVRNYHITWPAGVRDWFLLSFFPQTGRLPPSYEPYLDELLQVYVDGRSRVLARTGTTCGANFWAQPQQSPSADGSRVLFHSNGTCTVGKIGQKNSGTLDQCILSLRQTRVSLHDNRWQINDLPTYPATPAEGLLLNLRAVNSVFEDTNDKTRPQGFDADANTAAFIEKIPDYMAHGVRAFTLGLQGGHCGYEGAVNSAFAAEGTLREVYLQRVRRVIEACDRHGAVVILGCYYQRQDQVLKDEAAVRAGVVNVANWIKESGFTNVVLEIANEFAHAGFDHKILKSSQGEAELMALAKKTAPGLLVSTSGMGSGTLPDEVIRAADFLLIHFNSTKLEDIPARIAALKKYGKPIVCNEDDKVGAAGAKAAELCVTNGASWGFMHNELNQYFPKLSFSGAIDDPDVYAALKRLSSKAADYFPPPDAQGGWRKLTDAAEIRHVAGMDSRKLEQAFEFIKGSTKHGGLLVLRHGHLVYESYFGLGHRDATPNLASCGKSFTSIAVGILMAERPDLFPDGLDQKIFTPTYFPGEAFPLSDPRKEKIKLGQLLAFSAGIRGNNPAYVKGRQTTINPIGPDGWQSMVDAFALGKRDGMTGKTPFSTVTLWCDPGEGYSYASSSIHLAAVMLRHIAGMKLQEYLERHLAQPLGWGRWGFGYKNQPEVSHTPGGGGIALRGTDMLRFGYLLLQDGRWNDRQLIPAAYVLQCARQSPYNSHYPYSLQFNVNTAGNIPSLPRDAFWKSGSGGHVLYVVPSLDLVVWKLGGRDEQYSPANTGLPASSAPSEQVAARSDWKETVDTSTAQIRTLELVIDAIDR